MPVYDSHTQGTPDWVELVTPDQRAAAAFYAALLGWQTVENPLTEGGFYIVGSLDGDAVAGIAAQPQGLAGQPAFWNVYLSADDVDAVTARAETAGGAVEAGPVDVLDLARTATLTDPYGVRLTLWQRRTWVGTVAAGQPGTPVWSDPLAPGRASPFYADVLGLAPAAAAVPAGFAGLAAHGPEGSAPTEPLEEAPPDWNVHFHVADLDAAVAQADALGATVVTPPFDADDGARVAVLTDPQGALFALRASR